MTNERCMTISNKIIFKRCNGILRQSIEFKSFQELKKRSMPIGKVISTRVGRGERENKRTKSTIANNYYYSQTVSAMNEWSQNGSKQCTMFQHFYFSFFASIRWLINWWRIAIVIISFRLMFNYSVIHAALELQRMVFFFFLSNDRFHYFDLFTNW